MQVRSLSIKTTEILQLDLAIREEMENVIDELDALLFAVNFDPMTATQQKAIASRIHTLSQISLLLPAKKFFARQTACLTNLLASQTSTLDELCIQAMLEHLNALRELLRYPPPGKTPPPPPKVAGRSKHNHHEFHHQFVPFTAKDNSSQTPINPEAETQLKSRTALEAEFHLTTAALRDVLKPALSANAGRVQHLLSHATQIFQDLAQTAKGQTPTTRPTLDRIPCLMLSIRGQCFALPQKSVLRVLNPSEYRSHVEIWEHSGGRILTVGGQSAGEICLATVLGFSPDPQTENLPYVLVGTTRGAILMAAETSGDFVSLVPDLSAPLLSQIGPYLGAAISPDAQTVDQYQVVMILSPEEIAKHSPLSQPSSPTRARSTYPAPDSEAPDDHVKSLVAITPQHKLISIPMEQVSHVELVPASAVISHGAGKSIRIGQRAIVAVDPDAVISAKSSPFRLDAPDFQAVIVRREADTIAILTREIIGPKQESNLTDFGFDQKPGIRGTALCDDMVVCALDPGSLLETFSHFSGPTLKRAKIS